MAKPFFARTRLWFGRFWWFLDASRRVSMNLLFLLVIVLVFIAIVTSGRPALADKTALVFDLKGQITEQRASNLRESILGEARGDTTQKTRLRDVLAVLDAAAKDPNIARVVLELDDFEGAGLPTLREMAAALERFKASGKTVVAWASKYDQRQYYLAAHANEVLLHPMGMVYMQGYGRLRNYYRDALDKVGVSANVIRVGTYKSFAEPYIANGPSDPARQAESFLYSGLWSTYTAGVETARKLPAGTLMAYINEAPQRLAAVGGDAAKAALAAKLVDGLKTPDELVKLLMERGAKDDKGKSFRQVSFDDYLARIKKKLIGDAIGVVVAEGEIVDGTAPAGTVGGVSTSELIRKAREDDAIKAVVLRVNSPGGSAFASELVRRELELTRAAGKPVVVSMGDVAASGGYWISMASDEVMADPATITGSIGVFALLPSADKAMEKIGVHADGVTTTWLGTAGDPRRPLDPRFTALLQTMIDHVYADFTGRAAQARKTTAAQIDEVAQGRVWTGAQAKERGLVDSIGGFSDAIKSAAARGKLAEGYRVTYIEREPGRLARLIETFNSKAASVIAKQFNMSITPPAVPPKMARDVQQELGWLAEMGERGKPFMALTHCFCTPP
ncbi:MAG: signal peptide peptidase SppA [Burkholderiales bacterium]|nr:signal peptide peptidase SppA [Burkholderiales bacterium]